MPMFSNFSRSKYFSVLSIVFLVVGAFFVAQTSVLFIAQLAFSAGLLTIADAQSVLLQLCVSVVVYALALLVVLFVYNVFKPIKDIQKLLAFRFEPKPVWLVYVVLGYLAYAVLSVLSLMVVSILFPDLNLNQKQDIGFQGISTTFEYVVAFVTLVVLAPFAEEVIFRGFLYTKVREKFDFLTSALVVSTVFGAIHMQWNVAIDVFTLSLVLCFVREKTGSIWSGVAIHMLKNGLAYAVLFGGLQLDRLITG